jgi:hypothetical protein
LWVTGEYFDGLRDVEVAARGRLGANQSDPFDRLEWFKRTWTYEPLGKRPFAVRARVSGAEAWLFFVRERPTELAPLAGRHTLRFSPIFAGDPDPAVQRVLIGAAARRLRKFGIARLQWGPTPAEPAHLLRTCFRQAGWIAVERGGPTSYALDVGGRSFDDYWDGRADPLHEQIAAGARQLNVEIADLLSPRLWEEVQLLAGADHFLRELAEDATLDRTLRIAVARVGDAPVAAQLWTTENGRAWCHWRAQDRDARQLHPAAQLTASMLRYLMNVDHVETVDFGIGSEAELGDWAGERQQLRMMEFFNPRMPAVWLPMLGAKAAALVHRPRLD